MSKNINFPFSLGCDGRAKLAGTDKHIKDLIQQVLFTSPGERVNRPSFGCGLGQLVFQPNSTELAAATQFLVQGALQQWLGDLVQVHEVTVSAEDSTLEIVVVYTVIRSGEQERAVFKRGMS